MAMIEGIHATLSFVPRLGPRRPARGFTLIELVTAAAIFSILGVMLLTMVRSGMNMWKRGELSRNESDRAVMALETIARELRLAFTENDPFAGPPAARFLCDFLAYDRNGDGIKETQVQRLRFVRINMEERENDLLRKAGDVASGWRHFTLLDSPPLDEALPTGGLAEAAFMAFAPKLAKGEKSDGLLSLYRGYRTPLGGEDGYFVPGNLERPQEIEAALYPILDSILHLEFRFWDSGTRSFDPEEEDPESPGGAGYTWDSTRGILSSDPGAWPNRFRQALRPSSLDFSGDDIFPEKVMITVVVEDPVNREWVARTVEEVSRTSRRIPLDVIKPFANPRDEGRFVRIGEEWIEIDGVEGNALLVKKRGVRRTVAAKHIAGSAVHKGSRFFTVVEIPSARPGWQDEDGD
jgi:prepilin-type N-terminal cleavage/methylation domain-containing protein